MSVFFYHCEVVIKSANLFYFKYLSAERHFVYMVFNYSFTGLYIHIALVLCSSRGVECRSISLASIGRKHALFLGGVGVGCKAL